MKIAIDASQINRDRAGVNTYLRKLIKNIVKHSEHQFYIYARRSEELEFDLPENCEWVIIPSVPKLLGGGLTWYWKAGRNMRSKGIDALIEVTMNTSPFFFRKTLMVVHDLTPITMPATTNVGTRFWYRCNTWLARKYAWKIMALSEQTKREFKRLFPGYQKEIRVTDVGLNEWVLREVTSSELEKVKHKLQLPDRYVLSHSTIQPRKNYVRMLQAFAQVQKSNPDLHYVISGGKGWFYDQVFEEANKLKLADRVHFLGFVDEQDLPALFDQSSCFMFMSVEEGFGLPVIEARARGLPVLISEIPVFRDLKLDELVTYANPRSVEDIAHGLAGMITKAKKIPSKEYFSQYDWRSVADLVLAEATRNN